MRALEDMGPEEVRAWARDLLLQRENAVADLDRRRQELPYHPLLALYEDGSETLRERLSRAVLALLKESAVEPWPVESLHYLLTVTEEIRPGPATEILKGLVSSKAWLEQPEGTNRQMLALRTLVGLGWYGDPNFWLQQHELLDREYPVVVFRALAAHDLKLAFEHLEFLVGNNGHVQKLLQLLPTLIERHSLDTVREAINSSADKISPEFTTSISEWFENRGYRPIVGKTSDVASASEKGHQVRGLETPTDDQIREAFESYKYLVAASIRRRRGFLIAMGGMLAGAGFSLILIPAIGPSRPIEPWFGVPLLICLLAGLVLMTIGFVGRAPAGGRRRGAQRGHLDPVDGAATTPPRSAADPG